MKTCEHYRTTLTDAAAADGEPSLELRSHLEACTSCRAAVAEETQLFAAIDLGVRTVANAEVPTSLLPRVRVQLSEQAVPNSRWIPAAAVIAAAVVSVAVVAVLAFVRGFGHDRVPTNPAANSSTHNTLPAEIQSAPAMAPSIRESRLPARTRPEHSGQTAAANEGAQVETVRVLIPAGQKRAIEALLASVRQGKAKADILLTQEAEGPLKELGVPPLVISPIELKPLADASAEPASEDGKTRR